LLDPYASFSPKPRRATEDEISLRAVTSKNLLKVAALGVKTAISKALSLRIFERAVK
jgi:hypothetical protein